MKALASASNVPRSRSGMALVHPLPRFGYDNIPDGRALSCFQGIEATIAADILGSSTLNRSAPIGLLTCCNQCKPAFCNSPLCLDGTVTYPHLVDFASTRSEAILPTIITAAAFPAFASCCS